MKHFMEAMIYLSFRVQIVLYPESNAITFDLYVHHTTLSVSYLQPKSFKDPP